ncbi:MAG: Fe(3+) dicitrate transport protein, partial [Arcticibacterium sp.]
DWNIANTLFPDSYQTRFNWFVNMAITSSEYLDSEENNVIGKKVEFIPLFNFKTGLKAGFKNMFVSTQLSYLSEQFTDVQNSQVPDDGDNRNGVIGTTPSYLVIDFSASYTYKNLVFETGINNVLNSSYFTRRATGYPGPGIIPSDGRSGYFTFGVKI